MPVYRYRIFPRSAFATPMRSDTLYGHLLWAAAEFYGRDKVEKLIADFKGLAPPFKLSSAFPAGFLPMPVLPGVPRSYFRKTKERTALLENLTAHKEFRKLRWLPVAVWRRHAAAMSQRKLFEEFLQDKKLFTPPRQEEMDQPHNSIDRRTGSVRQEGGGLFFTPVRWLHPEAHWDIYVETERLDEFETLLKHVAGGGFGADRSIGKGQFDFQRDLEFDGELFGQDGALVMTLSLCATDRLSEVRGWYAPFVKHGRAWSSFKQRNPFKRPFLAFKEGSVFVSLPQEGYVLEDVHPDQEVVQVTWPLTLAMSLEGAA